MSGAEGKKRGKNRGCGKLEKRPVFMTEKCIF
jgi:hypothetical protein